MHILCKNMTYTSTPFVIYNVILSHIKQQVWHMTHFCIEGNIKLYPLYNIDLNQTTCSVTKRNVFCLKNNQYLSPILLSYDLMPISTTILLGL